MHIEWNICKQKTNWRSWHDIFDAHINANRMKMNESNVNIKLLQFSFIRKCLMAWTFLWSLADFLIMYVQYRNTHKRTPTHKNSFVAKFCLLKAREQLIAPIFAIWLLHILFFLCATEMRE